MIGTGTGRSWQYGAAAGAVGAILFLASGLAFGDQPALNAGGVEVAAFFDEEQTGIQVGCALIAAAAPFIVWFLATAAGLARAAGPRPGRIAVVGFGCGLVYFALFLTDVSALAVGALRPEHMRADPELAAALYDFSWMLPAMAAPLGSGLLLSFAVLALREAVVWPRWFGWLAAIAALAHALRLGALFTTEGELAADGAIGFWTPVVAIVAVILLGSIVLALSLRARVPEPN
jgi:hypothetical protein